jgi:2-succinyl-5-enolpyruvyl-6-hydroxy-3-cyclohexene-1-carboxylate synthase
MISSNKTGVQILVEQCVAHGMEHVVCSPGSRNAPIVIAMDEHPLVTCYVIHDERSAAFFAIGLAQKLGKPVGVVCTSGSAALNYYPAVAEAYYQCVPLVVLTADRPSEWIDQGDGQTIVQKNVFKGHVRYDAQISEKITSPDDQWYMEREIATAFSEGTTVWKGPIHFNIALGEPLYGTAEIEPVPARKIELVRGVFHFSPRNQEDYIRSMRLQKKMVICGQLDPDPALLEQLKVFANDSSVAILVENTSNLVDHKFIHCIDRTLNAISESEMEDFAPDLLITIGGAVISKKIKSFIRKYKPKEHWKIGFEFPYMDTYQCLSQSFQTEPAIFFREMNNLNYERSNSLFGAKWKQKDFLVQDKMGEFFQKVEYSDIKVFETVLDYLPEEANLHMANSSVVRYCQLFDPIRSVTYYSNRGTSGIDGSTSTACGAAAAEKDHVHVIITGDVSFFYDSNALWNNYLGENLRIILINNAGGGIFRIIPGPATSKQREQYFEARHQHNAEHIANAFGIHYLSAASVEELEALMADFYAYEEGGRPKLLEIRTPEDRNHLMLEEFFKAANVDLK